MQCVCSAAGVNIHHIIAAPAQAHARQFPGRAGWRKVYKRDPGPVQGVEGVRILPGCAMCLPGAPFANGMM
jgi:hypothetical protein